MKKAARESRGEISDVFLESFINLEVEDLIHGLYSPDPCIRTASAGILGKRKDASAVEDLCKCIKVEKSLYSRISMSEALGAIGTPSLKKLLNLVGKVGKNQHHKLPGNLFRKWNYPLPRDIIIRTIVKIGQPALELLNLELKTSKDIHYLSEIIDAVGYISFYSGDTRSYKYIMEVYNKFKGNKVIVWKIIRALQAYNISESLIFLKKVLIDSNCPEHRWESARSLGQIGSDSVLETLKYATNDSHENVREMALLSINKILHKL